MTDVPPSVPPSPAVPDAVLAELARLCAAVTPGEAAVCPYIELSLVPDGQRVSALIDPPTDSRRWLVFIRPGDIELADCVPTEADAQLFASARNLLPALIFELAARRAAERSEP